jgi:hypothetical protein
VCARELTPGGRDPARPPADLVRSCGPLRAQGAAPNRRRSHRGRYHTDRQPAVAEPVYVPMLVVGANVGAAVWAAFWAGACDDGGGAAGGWMRPAPGPPLPAARAAQPEPTIGRAPEIHLHLHGVSAEDIAAILNRRHRWARTRPLTWAPMLHASESMGVSDRERGPRAGHSPVHLALRTAIVSQ